MGALDIINGGSGVRVGAGAVAVPTVNDASLTFTGSSTGTFTANDADNLTINIPTAFDGNYNSLSNRPTIGNGTLTFTGGASGTFRANQTGNTSIAIPSGGGAPAVNGVGTVVYARYQPGTNVFFSGYFTFTPRASGNPSLSPIMHRQSGATFFSGARIVGGTWRSGGSIGTLVNENVDTTYTRIA